MRPHQLLLLSLAAVLPRATLPAQTFDPLTTLHLSAQQVLFDASVENRKTGTRIAGLTPEDFLLTEDGVPQPVNFLSEDRLPLSLVFLFDVTDSVQPVLKPLAAGSRTVLGHLRPEDEVAVMTFSNHAILQQGFTSDHAQLEAALLKASRIHSHTPTILFRSIVEATAQVTQSTIPNSRRVEIWLTDGTSQDHVCHNACNTAAEATEAVLRANVVVAGLEEHSWMTDFMTPKMVLSGSMGAIGAFGDLTGGRFLKTSRKEVADRFAELLDTLRERYTLGFRPLSLKPAGTVCPLHLELSPAFYARNITLHPEDVVIRTRQSYSR